MLIHTDSSSLSFHDVPERYLYAMPDVVPISHSTDGLIDTLSFSVSCSFYYLLITITLKHHNLILGI